MPEYTLSFPLAPGPDTSYVLNGINKQGQIVGAAFVSLGSTAGPTSCPAWWSGSSSDCSYDSSLGSGESQLYAINDSGLAAGILIGPIACELTTFLPGPQNFARIAIPASLQSLPEFPVVVAINNSNRLLLTEGIVLQVSELGASPANIPGILAGCQGMNNKGDIVGGNSEGAFAFIGSVAWNIVGDFCLYDINDNQLAVGYTTSSGPTLPFYVDLSGPQSEWHVVYIPLPSDRPPVNSSSRRIAINNSGMIVGNVGIAGTDGINTYPFFFQGPTVKGGYSQQLAAEDINLHVLDDVTLIEARAINDAGVIVGSCTPGIGFVATPPMPGMISGPWAGLAIEGLIANVAELKAQLARVEAELEKIMKMPHDRRIKD